MTTSSGEYENHSRGGYVIRPREQSSIDMLLNAVEVRNLKYGGKAPITPEIYDWFGELNIKIPQHASGALAHRVLIGLDDPPTTSGLHAVAPHVDEEAFPNVESYANVVRYDIYLSPVEHTQVTDAMENAGLESVPALMRYLLNSWSTRILYRDPLVTASPMPPPPITPTTPTTHA